MQLKKILRVFLIAGVILLIPLVAMQFTDEVNWEPTDFLVMGALLVGAGLAYELLAARVKNATQRAVVGIAVVAVVLLIWIELAVGIF